MLTPLDAAEFGVVTNMEIEVRILGGQPRYCILHSASRGLSATAEFLVCPVKLHVLLGDTAVLPRYFNGAPVLCS